MKDRFGIFLMWLRDLGGSYTVLRDDPPTEPKTPRTPRHKLVQRKLDPKKYFRTDSGQVRKRAAVLTEDTDNEQTA